MGPVSQALEWLGILPAWALLAILAGGALLENLVPPVPADTFVVVGGLLAARGAVPAGWLLLAIWVANVAGALMVYGTAFRHGRAFFDVGLGRHVLSPGQLRRIAAFYGRWGIWTVFLARFLPGLRAVVPAFAGVSHLPFHRVAPPLAAASAIWYGALFWGGMQAARSLPLLEEWLAGVNRWLLAVAVVVALAVGVWWIRTRREGVEEGHDGKEGGEGARGEDGGGA